MFRVSQDSSVTHHPDQGNRMRLQGVSVGEGGRVKEEKGREERKKREKLMYLIILTGI